jgi:hypothetical protein
MQYPGLGIGSRVSHPDFGAGVVVQVKTEQFVISFIEHGIREISRVYDRFEIIEELENADDMVSFGEMEQMLIRVLRKFSDVQETVTIADKWKGGMMELKPSSKDLKSYELPINTFFHKIIMVRDRVRVMEQKINSSNLEEPEKIDLQQYIHRIYGSLTSFNILFKHKNEDFSGIRKD